MNEWISQFNNIGKISTTNKSERNHRHKWIEIEKARIMNSARHFSWDILIYNKREKNLSSGYFVKKKQQKISVSEIEKRI